MKNRCSITSLVMRARIRATATRRPLIPEVELAWLAGFIDGEGTIYVVHERRSANRIVLKARMSIDNTDERNIMRVLRLVSRITGYRPPTQEGNSKRATVHAQACESIARSMWRAFLKQFSHG